MGSSLRSDSRASFFLFLWLRKKRNEKNCFFFQRTNSSERKIFVGRFLVELNYAKNSKQIMSNVDLFLRHGPFFGHRTPFRRCVPSTSPFFPPDELRPLGGGRASGLERWHGNTIWEMVFFLLFGRINTEICEMWSGFGQTSLSDSKE